MGALNSDHEVRALHARATRLAGTVVDLARRASVYHHLYTSSGSNHTFPLLAAHGALWASGYFRAGIRFGAIAAAGQGLVGGNRRELVNRLNIFANEFRDINRRVCVETYFIYQLTADAGKSEVAASLVPSTLREQMSRCHAACRAGRSLSDAEKRSLFSAFFLWEQTTIVGPAIEKAFREFQWPLIKHMALRPKIRFAYFPPHSPLAFRNFADLNERVAMGMHAFDRACGAGWSRVERSLLDYRVMPAAFVANPKLFFEVFAEGAS